MIQKWKTLSSTKEGDYSIFTVNREEKISPVTGGIHTFFTIDSKDWVNIIALTEERKIVLVRQYRHGIHDVTLEVPAGMLEKRETPIEAGLRELSEETGYVAKDAVYLGFVHPNPALFTNTCHTILAQNVVHMSEQTLDGTEDIDIEEWNLSEIPDAILVGKITSPFTISAFALFSAWEKRKEVR